MKPPCKAVRGILQSSINASRRETLYRMLAKRNNGVVPCYVCGKHVSKNTATLEHIRPRSLGGTHDMSNLAISHRQCNARRGNDLSYPCAGGD